MQRPALATGLRLPAYKVVALSLLGMLTVQLAVQTIMRYTQSTSSLFAGLSYLSAAVVEAQGGSYGSAPPAKSCNAGNTTVDLSWHAPVKSNINDLAGVINGTGIYGFIFNTSQGPLNTYDWCNMPHTNVKTYPKVNDSSYKLEYVEVIHRHHKRTPYAANTFPTEGYAW